MRNRDGLAGEPLDQGFVDRDVRQHDRSGGSCARLRPPGFAGGGDWDLWPCVSMVPKVGPLLDTPEESDAERTENGSRRANSTESTFPVIMATPTRIYYQLPPPPPPPPPPELPPPEKPLPLLRGAAYIAPDMVERAESRERWKAAGRKLSIPLPETYQRGASW